MLRKMHLKWQKGIHLIHGKWFLGTNKKKPCVQDKCNDLLFASTAAAGLQSHRNLARKQTTPLLHVLLRQ